jgi:hypothetical protein
VVLHPHPEGAYRELFLRAARSRTAVKYYGDRFARLSPISETRDGVFTGRLATWTEIDPQSNLIEKDTLDEIPLSESNYNVPTNLGFNARVFTFAFREADHRLYLELLNDEGEKISIGSARNAFERIFVEIIGEEADEVSVHVVSSTNGIKAVLETPGLRKLRIKFDLPNPDVLTARKNDLIAGMRAMRAKTFEAEFTRMKGEDRLETTPGVIALGELAAENGFAEGEGKNEDGESIHRSTKDFPLELSAELEEGESRALATRRLASR